MADGIPAALLAQADRSIRVSKADARAETGTYTRIIHDDRRRLIPNDTPGFVTAFDAEFEWVNPADRSHKEIS